MAPDHSTICRFQARLGPGRRTGHDRLRIIDATHVTVNSGRWTVTDHRSPVTADKGYDTNASHQKLKLHDQRSREGAPRLLSGLPAVVAQFLHIHKDAAGGGTWHARRCIAGNPPPAPPITLHPPAP